MKKLLTLLAMVCLTASAVAQVHVRQSFLQNCRTAQANVGGSISNGVSGIVFTNAAGTRLVTTNNVVTDSNTARVNLLSTVALWSLRDGSPPCWQGYPDFTQTTTGGTNTAGTTAWGTTRSFANVFIHFVGEGAGATNAVTFTFCPIYDGYGNTIQTNVAERWVVGVTGNGAADVKAITNAPLWRWPGAKGLALTGIYNAGAGAGTVEIYDVSLNGYRP